MTEIEWLVVERYPEVFEGFGDLSASALIREDSEYAREIGEGVEREWVERGSDPPEGEEGP